MPSKSIIDSRLSIRLDFDASIKANSYFRSNLLNFEHLCNQLLLYDTLIIPTIDFGIIPILISWMGFGFFKKAIENGLFRFLHKNWMLGYMGNGGGLASFTIRPGDKKQYRNWWQEATFSDSDKSLELQIKSQCPFITNKEKSRLIQKILINTIEYKIASGNFKKNIAEESYKDIQKSKYLTNLVFSYSNKKENNLQLNALDGIDSNQVRILNLEHIKDSIDVVLRIAEINLEILFSQKAGDSDIGTSKGADILLIEKLKRNGALPSTIEKFISLLELNNIPNIGKAIYQGSIEFKDYWKTRNNKESIKFRAWLRNADVNSGRELEKLFMASLGKSSLIDTLPMKMIRIGLTAVAGLLSPLIGITSSTVDSIFVNRWLNGYSPKLFLDNLGKLVNARR